MDPCQSVHHGRSNSSIPNSEMKRSAVPVHGKSNSTTNPRTRRVEIKLYVNTPRKAPVSTEEREIEYLKSKPTINRKSKELAEKAEKKFFEQFFDDKKFKNNPSDTIIATKGHFGRIPRVRVITPLKRETSYLQEEKEIEHIPKSQIGNSKHRKKHRHRSTPKKRMINMSVLERNQRWLDLKQKHISAMKDKQNQDILKECTFKPKQYCEYSLIPPSVLEKFHGEFNHIDLIENKKRYSSLSPYQLQVSFKAGCDLGQLKMRSIKSNE